MCVRACACRVRVRVRVCVCVCADRCAGRTVIDGPGVLIGGELSEERVPHAAAADRGRVE